MVEMLSIVKNQICVISVMMHQFCTCRLLQGSDMGYGLWFVEFCMLQLIGNLCSGE